MEYTINKLFKIFRLVIIPLIYVFVLVLPEKVEAVSFSEINKQLGITIRYTGDESSLSINQSKSGVYRIKSPAFPCSPEKKECEPDRYELEFPKYIKPIYGLGMQASANQLEVKMQSLGNEVERFLDTDFSAGHSRTADEQKAINSGHEYNGDIGRMKTPVFILPTESIIIAYIQPAVKMLRVTRSPGSTTFVLKKHPTYNEGSPGKLLIVKGANIADAYSKYFQVLQQEGFFFKKPHWQAFGINWETYGEFHTEQPVLGGATAYGLRRVVEKYEQAGIKLSTLTFGSGYWQSKNSCDQNWNEFSGIYFKPTIDSLKIREPELKSFFQELINKNIYPMVGMRHHASANPGNGLTNENGEAITGEQLIADKFSRIAVCQGKSECPFFSSYYYPHDDFKQKVKMLNYNLPEVISSFIDLTQQAYGPYKGIKEDEMPLGNQKRIDPAWDNLPEGTIGKSYQIYDQKFNSDFVIFGRNDWFSVGTDGQNGQGWIDARPPSEIYAFKYALDSALTQVVSGYPRPKIEFHIHDSRIGFPMERDSSSSCQKIDCNATCGIGGNSDEIIDQWNECCKIPTNQDEQYLRTTQAMTFSPITIQTRGFWHLKSDESKKIYVFYSKLRNRLQQYVYDNARKWYRDGVPHLMRPLFIDYPDDANVYSLYTELSAQDRNSPRNEYMFGNALLVRPLFFDNLSSVSVYFPPGKWKPFIKAGDSITGGNFSDYKIADLKDYPVFLKENEILIIAAPDKPDQLNAYVYLGDAGQSEEYTLFSQDGKIFRLQSFSQNETTTIRNLDTNQEVVMTDDRYGKGFKTANINSLIGTNTKLPGDADGNGKVDRIDFDLLVRDFGRPNSPADFNGNGTVDIYDYNVVVENWGK